MLIQRTVGNQAVERLLKSGIIQRKLTISRPGDIYEQEADRIANAVMHREQQGSTGSSQAQSMQRQMPEEDKDKLQGKYRDDKIRRQMEEEEEKPT